MPYIPESRRKLIRPLLEDIENLLTSVSSRPNIGEFTYIVYRLMQAYAQMSYTSMSAVIGALLCAILEFYRTDVATYEEVKRRENGDVTLR